MKESINKVLEFNTVFRAGVKKTPTLIPYDKAESRYNLMFEENDEYLTAVKDHNLVEIADALGDQLYILFGTIINHGMQDIIEDVFNRIHENNMSKLENGKPIINGENGVLDSSRPLGKVLKPRNWTPVDLTDIVEQALNQ